MHFPGLSGVPETMLWTLHNRASEAMRPDGILRDPKAIEIYRAIDYDYVGSFGVAEPSHALRSLVFDEAITAFLAEHPDGVVVNLGEGLETQRYRIDNGAALWVSVDLPETIAIRERFIEPDQRRVHVACSALDPAWAERVPPGRPVFVTAQGLLMYLPADEIATMFSAAMDRLRSGWLMFDSIPGWLSRKTLSRRGWRPTARYTAPPMPWGVDRHLLEGVVRGWSPRVEAVEDVPFFSRYPRGAAGRLLALLHRVPIVNRYGPAVTKVRFGESAPSIR